MIVAAIGAATITATASGEWWRASALAIAESAMSPSTSDDAKTNRSCGTSSPGLVFVRVRVFMLVIAVSVVMTMAHAVVGMLVLVPVRVAARMLQEMHRLFSLHFLLLEP